MKSKIVIKYYIIFAIIISVFIIGCKEENSGDKLNTEKNINLPKYFYKKLTGIIGDDLIAEMNLIRSDSVLLGNYYYNKTGIPIEFSYNSRIDSNNKIFIKVFTGYDENYNEVSTGIFNGQFVSSNKIEGTWKNPKKERKYKFYLVEDYPSESVQLELNHVSKSFKNASIEFLIPQITDYSNKKVKNRINSSINKIMLRNSFSDEEEFYFDYEEAMDDFIERYKEFVYDSPSSRDSSSIFFENQSKFLIIFNSNEILSLKLSEYSYEGGAHGISNTTFYNYDLRTGDDISLNNIFKNDFLLILTKAAEREFRKQHNLSKDSSLNVAGFWFEDDTFTLNDNYSINKGGITFLYNQYEIAPYAAGTQEVFIPYSEIKEIIREDGLLNFVFK